MSYSTILTMNLAYPIFLYFHLCIDFQKRASLPSPDDGNVPGSEHAFVGANGQLIG